MERMPAAARLLWRLIEPVHAVSYFAPEPIAEFSRAGYRGFWMGYFAGRAAPLGPVGPELVYALFYNFTFNRVARALPDAWTFAPASVALEARERGATAALRRQLGDLARDPCVVAAADLLAHAAHAAPLEGRPLFAANRALPEPVEPIARLWHFATLLREHRGDGHIATLLSFGITGRQSHVLQSLAIGMPKTVYVTARDFSDSEWEDMLAELRSAGYVDAAGKLTDAGRAIKDSIEARTDELAWSAYAGLPPGDLDALADALRPIARAVVRAGDIPLDAPMGLNLSELAD
jgi:Helix-turn-helix family